MHTYSKLVVVNVSGSKENYSFIILYLEMAVLFYVCVVRIQYQSICHCHRQLKAGVDQ
jgi:hypothetical protein